MWVGKNSIQSNCGLCLFRKNSVFKNCPPELLDDLFSNKEWKKFGKGELIIGQGDPFSGLYCIQEGIVKVSKKRNKGKEFILWFARPGDVIGLDSFISNDNYSFSAISKEPVTACFIHEQDFNNLLKKDPAITICLMKNLCDKITFIEDRISSIARKKIREQFAEMLISLAVKNKKQETRDVQLEYSMNDLADTIGTTKNYLYKILSDFSKKNLVQMKNRKLVIKNIDKLSLVAIGDEVTC